MLGRTLVKREPDTKILPRAVTLDDFHHVLDTEKWCLIWPAAEEWCPGGECICSSEAHLFPSSCQGWGRGVGLRSHQDFCEGLMQHQKKKTDNHQILFVWSWNDPDFSGNLKKKKGLKAWDDLLPLHQPESKTEECGDNSHEKEVGEFCPL